MTESAEALLLTAARDAGRVLYFGNDWDAENRTSSHQIAGQLARANKVVYIECPGVRTPSGSSRDIMKIARKLWRFLRPARRVSENLHVVTLLVIPGAFGRMKRVNEWAMAVQVWYLELRFGMHGALLWFVVPHLAPLARRMEQRFSVYYCIDKYASMPGVDAGQVAALDAEMTRSTNVVFAASEPVYQDKVRAGATAHLSPHGVQVAHFGRAASGEVNRPDDMPTGKPVVGYFGLVEAWTDLQLLDRIARDLPDWNLVLIGRCAVDVDDLARHENVHLLGKRPFESLPAYAAFFDVAILPYRICEQVLNSNPIKLREYLAAGLPVVSVRYPEVEKFADLVCIADNHDAFVAAIEVARNLDSDAARAERLNAMADQTWERRVETVVGIINEEGRANGG